MGRPVRQLRQASAMSSRVMWAATRTATAQPKSFAVDEPRPKASHQPVA